MSKELMYKLPINTFKRETSRLGPAVVGAYIRILLDYFEQGQPPPDDDFVLARIAACDPETWADIRIKIERAGLFEIKTVVGNVRVWTHAETEAEIAAAVMRKDKSKKAAIAAGQNHTERAAQRSGTVAVGLDPKAPAEVAARESAAEQEFVEQIVDDEIDEDDGIPEPPVPQPPGIVFESGIDPEFKPTGAWIVEAQAEGYTAVQIGAELDSFKRYHTMAGTTSINWPELWDRWWNRKKPPLHPAEKPAKPRVEVSRRRAPPPS
jgi:uncharacterized protein YdaU (DUF1376 family)